MLQLINVPLITQEQTQWCWAASSLSILNFNRTYTSQSQYVTYVKSGKTSPLYTPNDPATVGEAQKGLDYFGVLGNMYYGSLSFSTIKSEIDTYNRPIYTAIRWLDQNNNVVGGHAVVMDGYYEYTNEGYQEIRYMDPWDQASYKTMEYNSFVFSNRQQKWSDGIKNLIKK